MRTTTLNATTAAQILFGPQWFDKDFDPEDASFASGADVCEWLAFHFGFSDDELRRLHARDRMVGS
jgi:hypothetical protein